MNQIDTSLYTEVLGVKIRRRTRNCIGSDDVSQALNISVHVTDACPGKCKFCSNTSTGFVLDADQFKRDYEKIRKSHDVGMVSFTGGEPTLYWWKIKECLSVIDAPVKIVNTMGLHLDRIDEPVEISLSRHHWDHYINEEILGTKLPEDYIEKCPMRKNVNLVCNVIDGYVDDLTKVKRYLDFSLDNAIPMVGFVGLMPINNYCKERGRTIPRMEDDSILPYRQLTNGSICSCANYCYTDEQGRIQLFYTRHNQCPGVEMGGRVVYKNGIKEWFNK